jgi:hypothetical protein
MPTPTYVPLATVTLASAVTNVTFSSIPATYRDLVIVASSLTSTDTIGRITINPASSQSYVYVAMRGNGSSASGIASAGLGAGVLSSQATAGTSKRLQLGIQILDYATTNKHKTILSRGDEASTGVDGVLSRWVNTEAVTSVQVKAETGNWSIGGVFSLYGIAG